MGSASCACKDSQCLSDLAGGSPLAVSVIRPGSSEALAQAVCTWRVVSKLPFPYYSEMSTKSKVVGTMRPGTRLRGIRNGDWVQLCDDDGRASGFMRIVGAASNVTILEQETDTSETKSSSMALGAPDSNGACKVLEESAQKPVAPPPLQDTKDTSAQAANALAFGEVFTWKVVSKTPFPFYTESSMKSKALGTKRPGTKIRGVDMGNGWIIFAENDAPGFMRIFGEASKNSILEKEAEEQELGAGAEDEDMQNVVAQPTDEASAPRAVPADPEPTPEPSQVPQAMPFVTPPRSAADAMSPAKPKQVPSATEAEAVFRKALDNREGSLGADHPDVLSTVAKLAVSLQAQGKYDEAEPLFVRVYETRMKSLGPEHAETLKAADQAAGILKTTGNYEQAEEIFKQTLATREKTLGVEDPETLKTLSALAVLLKTIGNYSEAEPLYRRVLEARERTLGKDHPTTLKSVNNLAVFLKAAGNYSEAEPLYRRTLEGSQRTLGAEHPNTLTFVNNLAVLLKTVGKYEEAEPLYMRLLEASERTHPPNHPDVLRSTENAAALLKAMGKLEEAEILFRRAVEGWEGTLGPNHPQTLQSKTTLAVMLESLGKADEASGLRGRS